MKLFNFCDIQIFLYIFQHPRKLNITNLMNLSVENFDMKW